MKQDIEEVYKRLEMHKKAIREINKMIRDQFAHIPRYQEIAEEMKTLREEKKALENEVRANDASEVEKMEDLKIEVATDKELLSDIALNKFLANENVEITDEFDNKWVPHFSVTFKRE